MTLICYQELNSIFFGYEVESSRILRDSHGNSRGVGFARYVVLIEHLPVARLIVAMAL
jgi:hypothetical protein